MWTICLVAASAGRPAGRAEPDQRRAATRARRRSRTGRAGVGVVLAPAGQADPRPAYNASASYISATTAWYFVAVSLLTQIGSAAERSQSARSPSIAGAWPFGVGTPSSARWSVQRRASGTGRPHGQQPGQQPVTIARRIASTPTSNQPGARPSRPGSRASRPHCAEPQPFEFDCCGSAPQCGETPALPGVTQRAPRAEPEPPTPSAPPSTADPPARRRRRRPGWRRTALPGQVVGAEDQGVPAVFRLASTWWCPRLTGQQPLPDCLRSATRSRRSSSRSRGRSGSA